jgi:UDP-glucose 4-epimerase
LKVLVTGGAGYIGSVLTSELVRAGNDVVVYDNLGHGHREAVVEEATLVQGDLSDGKHLHSVLKDHEVEAVMHFAASIEAGESMKVPEKFFRNNTASTLNLLEAMLELKINRLVFSSTAALYGNPETTPIVETSVLKPTNAYGESKLLVERMLEWFHRIHGFRYASLRYFNAAGATEKLGEAHQPETHLIPLILQVARGQRESISIFGTDYPTKDGTCVRDYVHVLDLAAAHILALGALEKHSQLVYNLGNGVGFTVREVIEVSRKVTGHAIPAVESPRRAGDPAVLIASSEKAKQELGWKPKYFALEDIVTSAWQWQQRFPNGYERRPGMVHV